MSKKSPTTKSPTALLNTIIDKAIQGAAMETASRALDTSKPGSLTIHGIDPADAERAKAMVVTEYGKLTKKFPDTEEAAYEALKKAVGRYGKCRRKKVKLQLSTRISMLGGLLGSFNR